VATRKLPKFGRSISELLNMNPVEARQKLLRTISGNSKADSSTKDGASSDGRSSRRCRALPKDSEHPSEEATLGFVRVQTSDGESVVFEGEGPSRLKMG
jgi:hypothetical protein